MSDNRSYADTYLLFCDGLKAQAEEKLGRSLTPIELGAIYNAGSLMMLESVGMAVEFEDKDKLIATLGSLKFADRLQDTRNQLPKILEDKHLNQPLHGALIEKLKRIPYVYTAQQIIAKLEKTPQEGRYAVLVALVNEWV